jgi:hypothetical protein
MNSANATTGKSPTEMAFGTTLRLFPSPCGDLAKPIHDVPAVFTYVQATQDNWPGTVMLRRRRNRRLTRTGNDVLSPNTRRGTRRIWKRKICTSGSSRRAKSYSRYTSPFEIAKAESKTSNYTLKLTDECQIQPKVHCRLQQAHETILSCFRTNSSGATPRRRQRQPIHR